MKNRTKSSSQAPISIGMDEKSYKKQQSGANLDGDV
jgi:hypothetical protein